ncbi:unnamed protein product [Euphydryas editha]|uniref:MICOS complex subunit n=1 Tax=Euphydryas editha TaxID=104508 RepID=A0AAU9TEL8_EUPED|nr:unnamed protein product [Euphydryas editha]
MKPRLKEKTHADEQINERIFINYIDTDYETTNTLNSILCSDIYILGRLWIEALKSAAAGLQLNLFPVVEAAKAPETPQKPPSMKYTDLPLYSCPHYEYKDYIKDKEKCPDANVKLLHQSLLPYVKCYREAFERNLCELRCAVDEQRVNACNAFRRAKKDFKQTMRDPNNLVIRQATVAAGGAAGYILGSGGGIPRRLIFTGLGFLAAGALCFPKETDEIFRDVAFNTGKLFISIYNKWCGKEFALRERLPCKDDVPPEPPKRKPVQCPQNK